MKKEQWFMAAVLFFVLAVSRWVPHAHNFTALSGVALFAGALWRKTSVLRFLVPLLAVFVSDFYFGFYSGMEWTYLGIAAGVLVAPTLESSVLTVASRAFWAAVLFFVFSNLGVWWTSGMYSLDTAGLGLCFSYAIPFFHNTLLSSLFYTIGFFSIYRWMFLQNGFQDFVTVRNGR